MTDAYERAKADDAQWEREHGDSREKLEAELDNIISDALRNLRRAIYQCVEQRMDVLSFSDGEFIDFEHEEFVGEYVGRAMKVLDRQAAITEREMEGVFLDRADVVITRRELEKRELQAKVDELNAQNTRLNAKWAEANTQVERLQAELDHAERDCSTCDVIAELRRKVRELQAKLDEYDQTHMVLPVDADGVPIKIGDKIQQLNHAGVWTDAMPVIAVDDHGCFALAHGIACDARTYVWGNNCRHVKQRTVEDVLRELADVARHDSEHGLDDGDIDGFAAEIRELMGVCDE